LTIAAVSTTPLVILEAAVVVGAVASIAIAGEEGLETYVDYISNPQEIPFDQGKTEALMQANRIAQAAITLGGSEIARAGAELLMTYKNQIFRNRWMTGPVLPF